MSAGAVVDAFGHGLHLASRFRRCRTQRGPGYPERAPVPAFLASWSAPFPAYAPPYHVADKVLAQDRTQVEGGWADPENSWHAAPAGVPQDGEGHVLCPMGRTGIRGRGLLGKWGANAAVDVVLLWWKAPSLHVLLIERTEPVMGAAATANPLALPGGMVDAGETVETAMSRELEEETGLKLPFDDASGAIRVYDGPVDDPRTTDHAWIETTAAYRLLDAETADRALADLRPASDARTASGHVITPALAGRLYASHGDVLRRVLWHLAARTDAGEAARAAAKLA